MCGIAGILTSSAASADTLTGLVSSMASALEARGPDDAGAWVDAAAGVALGHRRLAIVDLSAHGHQPMASSCGRWVLSFNGEIYNFEDLRRELEPLGHRFCGHSDTEVMLAAIAEWGVRSAVQRFNGMFAFAVWDKVDRKLTLVRDRLGEKPLYYGWADRQFLFGSDLRAIERHPAFRGTIDRQALSLYLRYGNVPAPHSIYQDFYKLPPGCMFEIGPSDDAIRQGFSPSPEADTSLHPTHYWSARAVVGHALANPFEGSAADATDALDKLLSDSVSSRMIADVPLGALLSGGVDSSVVAALMQSQSARPVRTFTVGFKEERFNEAGHAAAVAKHLGTDHTELYLTGQEALAIVERLPGVYDEPFADASQIPTTLLSGLVRKHVTVALSGDGGDELFGGYTRYVFGASVWGRIARIPRPLRGMAAALLRLPSPEQWDGLARPLSFLQKDYGANGTPGDRFHKLADVLGMRDAGALYERLVTAWDNPGAALAGGDHTHRAGGFDDALGDDVASQMMFRDLVGYLPDDILTKVDRASMSVSLEMRVPLLDHRVVEFAWSLPTSMKIGGGTSKRVLRDVLYRYVPRELIDRPKMGFGVPVGDWLRGPLRDWAESLLDEQALREDDLFDPGIIRARWLEHLSGRRNWTVPLWAILMFQAWRQSRRSILPAAVTTPGKKVLAVVVTHNRLELLKRCLNRVNQQTRNPDGVLVINNASTDGTEEYLRGCGIECVTQPNGGSAVGWHRGVRACLEGGYDFVWMMDDDGYPDARSLELLVEAFDDGHACVSSAVVKEHAPEELVFGLPKVNARGFPALISLPRKYHSLHKLSRKASGLVYPFAHLFNGALISAKALRQVGDIDLSYVLYGEELDYLWRLKKVGAVSTHTGALHYHPDVTRRPMSRPTPYYYIRNSLLLHRRYLDAPFVRGVASIVVVLARLHHRNGPKAFWRYVLGPDRRFIVAGVRHGLSQKMGAIKEE